VRRSALQVLVNLALVAAVFLAGAYAAPRLEALAGVSDARVRNAVVWAAALAVSLPFLVAAYRKIGALSLLLAEVAVKPGVAGQYTAGARRIVAEVMPLAAVVAIMLLVGALSSSILPPAELLVLVLAAGGCALALLWRWFVRLHARLQVALLETLAEEREHE
jgi:K+:H+ antiporter